MVGIVIVSHSGTLAEGVRELAAEMAGSDVKLELAGGLAEEGALGTDAVRVMEAIGRADSGDGVLVLMDLGSAVLSAETALDFLTPEQRETVLLCEAPLVEGAVAAAVAARLGEPLAQVAKEARGGLQGKTAQLGAGEPAAPGPAGTSAPLEEGLTLRLDIRNPLGLHARPAARFVQTAAGFDANVQVLNLTSGRGPASGRSLNGLATLGIRQGHEILVSAHGPQAAAALDALADLAKRDFDEQAARAVPSAPAAPPTALPDAGAGQALSGLAGAPGIVTGPARHFRPPDPEIPTGSSGDPGAEWDALNRALEQVRTEIRATRDSVASRAGDYSAAIFDAHLLFLDDEALLGPARQAIFGESKNAAEAWHEAAEAVAADYRGLDDEYMQARAEDLTGVARQVVAALTGGGAATLSAPGIVVAPDLTPADTASLDRELALGIATAVGSPTSHSAILARSLGIPAAVGLGEALLSVPEGTELLLDGDSGTVHVEPDAELTVEYKRRAAATEQAVRSARAAAAKPAVTRDGRRIEVAANIGSPDDVPPAIENGAEGVGLLRTEFLFLERDSMPSEDEQFAAYKNVAEALEGRPLILRTLDIGADKPLPYLALRPEANPFLGVRGIRLALEQPELLETQLRAVLRTAAEYPLKVMFPMVATLEEYRRAKEVLADVRAGLERAGAPTPDELDIGVMIEVPAAALVAEQFAPEVDFFSLGTNDLVQYTMAAERGNASVAGLADGLHPSVLRLIRTVAEAASGHGKWAGVCGELASDPTAVPLLMGLGIAELSANAPAIPAVKQAVRAVDTEAARELAEHALELSSASEVRQLVADETAVSSRSPVS